MIQVVRHHLLLVNRANDQRELITTSRKSNCILIVVWLTDSVAPEGKNAIDGLVAVLTVKIVGRPQVEADK
jgi:hypothetical protein